jgi:hypothetical protein
MMLPHRALRTPRTLRTELLCGQSHCHWKEIFFCSYIEHSTLSGHAFRPRCHSNTSQKRCSLDQLVRLTRKLPLGLFKTMDKCSFRKVTMNATTRSFRVPFTSIIQCKLRNLTLASFDRTREWLQHRSTQAINEIHVDGTFHLIL